MAELSDGDRFELWKSNNLDLYDRLRDIDLYVQCISEAMEDVEKLIGKSQVDGLRVKALREISRKMIDRFDGLRTSMDEIESVARSMSDQYLTNKKEAL